MTDADATPGRCFSSRARCSRVIRSTYGSRMATCGCGTSRARRAGSGGRRSGPTCPPATRRPWTCPECGTAHHDGAERLQLLDRGEWRPTKDAADPEITSYRMPRWCSPAATLAACVADHRRAVRKRTTAVWSRTCAALPADPDVDEVDVADRLVLTCSKCPTTQPSRRRPPRWSVVARVASRPPQERAGYEAVISLPAPVPGIVRLAPSTAARTPVDAGKAPGLAPLSLRKSHPPAPAHRLARSARQGLPPGPSVPERRPPSLPPSPNEPPVEEAGDGFCRLSLTPRLRPGVLPSPKQALRAGAAADPRPGPARRPRVGAGRPRPRPPPCSVDWKPPHAGRRAGAALCAASSSPPGNPPPSPRSIAALCAAITNPHRPQDCPVRDFGVSGLRPAPGRDRSTCGQ